MPVKAVELHQRHQVQKPEDRAHLVEMPRAIKMLAAPFKARRILDHAAGQAAVMGRAQGQKRDRPVPQAGRVGVMERDPIRSDFEPVALCLEASIRLKPKGNSVIG